MTRRVLPVVCVTDHVKFVQDCAPDVDCVELQPPTEKPITAPAQRWTDF